VVELSSAWKSTKGAQIKALLPVIISSAHQFSRKQAQSESGWIPVSLRDVERCVALSGWFLSIAEKKKVRVG
jgi:hypothetical protein